MNTTIKIKDFFDNEIEVIPKLFLYSVKDFMGKEMPGLGIQLYIEEDGSHEPYATLTVSFGEFIGMKNTAYIDVNNCNFAHQFLIDGIASDSCFTKHSGYCIYPLWIFTEEFLRDIGEETYKCYSEAYDNYMGTEEG